MHLLVRESRSLDDEAAAADLGLAPADLLLLSFSDSDLGAAAVACNGAGPSLRLVSLKRLIHPMSVDLFVDRSVRRARCVVVRLLGGLGYWRYGVDELGAACREAGVALALLPGDGQDDAALRERSTVPDADWATLSACFEQGGVENVRAALALAAFLGGVGPAVDVQARPVPPAGAYEVASAAAPWGRAAIVFYRSHLLAGDVAPVHALAEALAARGLAVRAFHAASLKEPACAEAVASALRDWAPDVVLNATAFAARAGGTSPLEAPGCAVLQVVLAGSGQAEWAGSLRGLSGTDLAMHVVLPELDGRLLAGAVSFKRAEEADPTLEFGRTVHAPDADGVALAAERACGWARLRRLPPPRRRVGIVLSDYPGGGRVGHAVGLDTFASLQAILAALGRAGYAVPAPDAAALVAALTEGELLTVMDGAAYRAAFATLPEAARVAVLAAWGEPPGAIRLRVMRAGTAVLAVQPDRGAALDRKAGYHDPDCPPTHDYVGFYLWLGREVDALVHLGAHGTLEWLPGKSVALSPACFPQALLGGLPVIYPFIVNNPGEAAAAKRRLGAVALGHRTPPLRAAGSHGEAAALEALLEEYAAADGMDRRRLALLRDEILSRAERAGLLGAGGADDRLARLDATLCDLKDARIKDGLHVFGAGAPEEMAALLSALGGGFVAPGPAGAPSRGRTDVLPTGRNLFSVDPRAVPTPTAVRLAETAAAALMRRHAQEQGEYPRRLVLNLWGSTTMRTGGEDLALALVLMGVRPEWDAASGRVTGFAVLPVALLDWPRVDVTLRISGLFRDAFAAQVALFDAAVRAVAARDEAADWNPLAGAAGARVFGPAPGCYGVGVADTVLRGAGDAGAAYLAGSSHGYGSGAGDFAERVRGADAYVQVQDHTETDVLEGTEWAAHAGGFAQAAARLGAAPALHHADTATPDAPAMRSVAEAVRRTVRTRAANPAWIASMSPHGYRGAAEVARGLEALFVHAATLPERFDPCFELLYAATLGDPDGDAWLRRDNPAARDGMAALFERARRDGLWRTHRNDLGGADADAAA